MTCLASSLHPTAPRLASAGLRGELLLWDAAALAPLATLRCVPGVHRWVCCAVLCCAWCAVGNAVARSRHLPTGPQPTAAAHYLLTGQALQESAGRRLVPRADAALSPPRPPAQASGPAPRVAAGLGRASLYALSLDAQGDTAAAGGTDGVVRLVDARVGGCVATLEGHREPVR